MATTASGGWCDDWWRLDDRRDGTVGWATGKVGIAVARDSSWGDDTGFDIILFVGKAFRDIEEDISAGNWINHVR